MSSQTESEKLESTIAALLADMPHVKIVSIIVALLVDMPRVKINVIPGKLHDKEPVFMNSIYRSNERVDMYNMYEQQRTRETLSACIKCPFYYDTESIKQMRIAIAEYILNDLSEDSPLLHKN